MLSLILGMITAASAVEGVRVEPLFLSVGRAGVMVRVHENGKVRLAACPVPLGPAPDLTYSLPGALDRCRVFSGEMADQPETLAAFGEEFERLVNEHARPSFNRTKVVSTAALTALGYAALQAGSTTVVVKAIAHDLSPAEMQKLYNVGFGFATVLGSSVFALESIGQATIERERIRLGQRPVAQLRDTVTGPAVVYVSGYTFRVMQRLAAEAVANVSSVQPL